MSKEIISRLREKLGGASALTQVSTWLCENTRIEGRRWSFKNHEFQIDIANDPASEVDVKKPTQVGLSELSVRIMLALAAIRRGFKCIYILPSANFASTFAKTRVDPVIESSPRLSEMVVTASNSAMTKRIGSSFIYMGGAATKNQAISIPAECLIYDELDFQDPVVSSSYSSRLAHAIDPREWRFSTPTLEGFGIDERISLSDKRRYLVRCEHCETTQAPEFRRAVRIPMAKGGLWNEDGFEHDSPGFLAFSKFMLSDPGLLIDDAYLACQKCHKSLTHSLLMADRREWVPEITQVKLAHGYSVKPFDLSYINTTPLLVRRFGKYADEVDYWNFAQGECHSAGDAQVSVSTMSGLFIETPLDRLVGGFPDGLCMGVDVGARRVHVLIGRREGAATQVLLRKTLHIADGEFLTQIIELFNRYRCVQGIIDMGPDFSLSRGLYTHFGSRFRMASYIADNHTDPMYYRDGARIISSEVDADADPAVVKVQRTKGFNALVGEINSPSWSYSYGDDQAELVEHFQGMKRLSQMDKAGDRVQKWVKIPSKEDHFFHAAMYLKVALDIAYEGSQATTLDSIPMTGVTGVTLGSGAVPVLGSAFSPPNFSAMRRGGQHGSGQDDASVAELARRYRVI